MVYIVRLNLPNNMAVLCGVFRAGLQFPLAVHTSASDLTSG